MLYLSKFPFKTTKNLPSGADNRGTQLLLQAWFIRQELAGAYNYTTLWLRVLRNIQEIIRQEMEATGSYEISMTALASQEKWETTLRWDSVDVLFKLRATENREYALNPTHEEVVTTLMKNWIQSYKDLECMSVYQFQTKFRNEKRAKSGILRWREFLMKDMYSFHRDQASLDTYFERAKMAYERVFERLGIAGDTYYTLSDGAPYAKYGYEFQTELAIGEDVSYVCDECWLGHNSEIVDEQQFICSSCESSQVTIHQVSEVGNIFKLGTKFSDDFGVTYTDQDGQEKSVYMGCYGIGVSRLMGVLAEKFSDDRGLVWSESIAPYTYYSRHWWSSSWGWIARKKARMRRAFCHDWWSRDKFWDKSSWCRSLLNTTSYRDLR